jgi:hypothetical protein
MALTVKKAVVLIFQISILLNFSVEKRCHPRAEDRELGMAVKKDQLAIFYNYLGLWLQR